MTAHMPTTVTMASGPTSPTTRPGARKRRASRHIAVITRRLRPPWRVGCHSVWNRSRKVTMTSAAPTSDTNHFIRVSLRLVS